MNEKPCSQDEIDAFFQFASLPLQERKRRIYERMIETMPDSPFVHDLLTGRIEMPKRRVCKQLTRAASKPKTAKPKTLKAKAATKAALPNGGEPLPKWATSPNPNIDWDD
jgi:hypothetical protein